MNRLLRDAMKAIREAGGKRAVVQHGAKHTTVTFTAANGRPQSITLHKGSNVTCRAERALRSELRKGKPVKGIYSIVGMKYRNAVEFVRSRPLGAPLVLEREPTNIHDSNAVKVIIPDGIANIHVGYVPREQALKLASKMDSSGITRLNGRLAADGNRGPAAEVDEA